MTNCSEWQRGYRWELLNRYRNIPDDLAMTENVWTSWKTYLVRMTGSSYKIYEPRIKCSTICTIAYNAYIDAWLLLVLILHSKCRHGAGAPLLWYRLHISCWEIPRVLPIVQSVKGWNWRLVNVLESSPQFPRCNSENPERWGGERERERGTERERGRKRGRERERSKPKWLLPLQNLYDPCDIRRVLLCVDSRNGLKCMLRIHSWL